MEFKVCSNCKVNKPETEFKKKLNGNYNKVCKKCCQSAYRCNVINKHRYICDHELYKYFCRDCNGNKICQHNKVLYQCKYCNDPIDITIKTILKCSKNSDKKYGKFDENNTISYEFLQNLINNSNHKCYYCSCDLQYLTYNDNLATIERLNNAIGHTTTNVVISCRKCNFKKIGSKMIKNEYENFDNLENL